MGNGQSIWAPFKGNHHITDGFEWAMRCVDFEVNLSLKTQGAKSVGRRLIEFPILKLMQHADCFKKKHLLLLMFNQALCQEIFP